MQEAFNRKSPEVIWVCLYLISKKERGWDDILFNSCHQLSGEIRDLLIDLKYMPIELGENLGEITFSWNYESSLDKLASWHQYIPITSITVKGTVISFESLICPLVEKFPKLHVLCLNYPSFEPSNDIPLLKKLVNLKEFTNVGELDVEFRNTQEIEEYLATLLPITPGSLYLVNTQGVTDEYLKKLEKRYPNLKYLSIGGSPPLHIPFKHLNGFRLKNSGMIHLETDVQELKCINCPELKTISAPNAKRIILAKCPSLLTCQGSEDTRFEIAEGENKIGLSFQGQVFDRKTLS